MEKWRCGGLIGRIYVGSSDVVGRHHVMSRFILRSLAGSDVGFAYRKRKPMARLWFAFCVGKGWLRGNDVLHARIWAPIQNLHPTSRFVSRAKRQTSERGKIMSTFPALLCLGLASLSLVVLAFSTTSITQSFALPSQAPNDSSHSNVTVPYLTTLPPLPPLPSLPPLPPLPTLSRYYSPKSDWPDLPYSQSLPGTTAYLEFSKILSDIGNNTETRLARRLLTAEIAYLTLYPHQFSGIGLSVARRFTDIILTCHSHLSRDWTLDVAIEMLRVLERDLGKWGVRDVEFEVLVDQEVHVFCRIWMNIWEPFAGSASS